MLSPDGYAFLNITHPLCAWATYRAVLVSQQAASDQPGFVSVWMATLLSAANPGRTSFEFELERVRREKFPDRVSRLTGLYCFLSLEDAEKAANLWGATGNNHFRKEYLAELHLGDATGRDQLDSGWITYAPRDNDGFLTATDWMKDYWSGKQYPGKDPIWETLVHGRVSVLGTQLRERAYDIVKERWTDSLCLLEISRLAAWIESDLGNLSAYLRQDGDDLLLEFCMDMRDAKDPEFLKRLGELLESDHPVNHADIRPHFENDSFGRTPDMKDFGFRRPIATF